MKSANNLLLGSYFTYWSYKCYNTHFYYVCPKNSNQKLWKNSNQEYTLINYNEP